MRRPEFISRLGSTAVALPAAVLDYAGQSARGPLHRAQSRQRRLWSATHQHLVRLDDAGDRFQLGFACAGLLGNVRSCLCCGVSRRRAACQCFAMRS
jgi:hypothetical protein